MQALQPERSDRFQEVISFGGFDLFPAQRLLKRTGKTVKLGSRAFDILLALVENAGEVISQRRLIEKVWDGVFVEDVALRVHIASLRKVLDAGENDSRYLRTVPGRGYCFIAPIMRRSVELAETLREGRPGNGRQNVPRLPSPPAGIVGRDDIVEFIGNAIATERLVSIVGPGGLGKTTVALAVAHSLLDKFRGAVFFVDLSPLSDPQLLHSVVASTFGIPVQTRDPLAELVAHLRGRGPTLLVLDSSEHVVSEVALLSERLIKESTNLHILLTSREVIRAAGEHVFRLPPLESPPDERGLTAQEVLAFPAARLFMQRVAGTGTPIVLTDSDVLLIGAICRKLGGIALAIELAAGRIGAFSLKEIAARLDSQFALTWPGRRTAPARHQTLGAMLDWSYRLLTPEEKRVFALLSVFAGPFDLAAACAVVDEDPECTESSAVIGELVSKSLICVVRLESDTRYRLLDTTKTFAHEKLHQAGELDAARRRHALLYLQTLKDQYTDESDAQAIKIGRESIEDVRAAIAWALHGEAALAVRLVAASIPLWESLGLFQEERANSTRALVLLEQLNEGPHQELELQLGLARAFIFTSRFGEEFKATWSRVQQLAETLQQTDRQLAATLILWGRQIVQANISDAWESVKIFRRNSEASSWTGMADWIEGVTSLHLGNYANARAPLQRAAAENRPAALTLQRKLVGFDCRWVALIHVALNCLMEGDAAQAEELAERAVAQACADDLDFPIEMGEHVGAMIFSLIGDRERARALAISLLRRSEERSLTNYHNVARAHLSAIDAWRGSEAAFIQLSEDASELEREGYGIGVYFAAERLRISIERRRNGLQAAALTPLAASPARIGSWYLPEIFRLNGRLAALQGRKNDAEDLLRKALEVAREQGSPFWELRVANDIAELWITSGKIGPARSLLEEAFARQVHGLDTQDVIESRSLLTAMESNETLS